MSMEQLSCERRRSFHGTCCKNDTFIVTVSDPSKMPGIIYLWEGKIKKKLLKKLHDACGQFCYEEWLLCRLWFWVPIYWVKTAVSAEQFALLPVWSCLLLYSLGCGEGEARVLFMQARKVVLKGESYSKKHCVVGVLTSSSFFSPSLLPVLSTMQWLKEILIFNRGRWNNMLLAVGCWHP